MNRSHLIFATAFAAALTFLTLNGDGGLLAQSVGINSAGALPNASALLDVDAAPGGNKGLLIPRIALQSTTDATTIPSPATSLLVYNSNAAMTGGALGFWYWDGGAWVSMGGGGGSGWLITGNTGITAANFLGPINNAALKFRTNNIHSGIIDPAGPTFLGYQAGEISTGIRNVGIGYQAMQTNTTGSNNTAIGYQALQTGAASTFNTCVGYYSLAGFTAPGLSGFENTAIGYATLDWLSTGNYNCALGSEAGSGIRTGDRNICIGKRTLSLNQAGTENVAVGDQAMGSSSTGSYNVAVGKNALSPSGCTYNTCVGYSADAAGTTTNATALGNGAVATASNQVRLGNASVASLFFGTASNLSGTATASNMTYNTATGEIQRFTSSRRYKTDIADLEVNSSKIYDLRAVSFTSVFDNARHFGLIAEEVASVIPELAEYAPEKNVVKGSTSERLIPDAVQYPILSVLLLKEVQKHEEFNKKQQMLIDDFKVENQDLRSQLEQQNLRIKKLEEIMNAEAKK